MKSFETLLEELNLAQRDYVDNELGGKEYNPEEHHKDMFDAYADKKHENRIVLSYEDSKVNNSDIDMNLRQHLAKNGWGIHDYRAGLASHTILDRDGKEKLEVKKIGKILQETGADKINHPEMNDRLIKGSDGRPLVGADGRYKSELVPQSLLHFYNNDPKRSSKGSSNITISRDKEDIAGMSSGRTWETSSCMRLPFGQIHGHGNHRKIKHDLKHGTLIAYSTKHGDDNIEKPMGRVLIKAYHANLPNGEKHTIYRTEHRPYGDPPSDFKNQVESLMKKHYPAKPDVDYKLSRDLYDDGRSNIEPLKIGLHKTKRYTENYNSEGNYHDYEDENGIKQPAVKQNNGDFTHYKNGLEHNEDGVAESIRQPNGVNHAYYVNGQRHRLGGLPQFQYIPDDPRDNLSHWEEYHVGGLLHRDGDLPAIDLKREDGSSEKSYHKYGMEHRDNGGISSIEDKNYVVTIHRKTFGKFNSPDNDTPAYESKTDSLDTKKYYKDDKLHRDNDLPAVTFSNDYLGVTVKKWYQHNILKRDGGKPHTIRYDKNTKKILEKNWDRPEGSKLPVSIVNDGKKITIGYNYNLNNNTNLISKVRHNDGDVVHNYVNTNGGNIVRSSIHRNGIMEYTNGNHSYKILKDKHGNHHILHDDGEHVVITKDGELQKHRYDLSTHNMFNYPSKTVFDIVNNSGYSHDIPKDYVANHFKSGLLAGGKVAEKIKELQKIVK